MTRLERQVNHGMRLILGMIVMALAAHAEFRAAVVKADITPKNSQWLMGYAARQSTGVHDAIYHKVAAFDDGTTQVFLIASDLCVFSPSVYDEFTRELEREAGIAPRQVWWTTTHTHSAPELGPPDIYDVLLKGRSEHAWDREYLALVKSTLAGAIKQARSQLKPARLAIGAGMASANINRRGRDLDGTISLGMNPDGPVDRQLGLIRIEHADGTPMGLIANYAMHGTALSGQWLEISGDAPGIVAAHVEQRFGAPMLYINGAAGNIAPIYSVQANPRAAHLGEFRVLLGNRILDAARRIPAEGSDITLALGEKWIETPRKAGLDWPASLNAYRAQTRGGVNLVRVPVRFLRINDIVLWSAPVELFCEIAMRVRNESPFRQTFFLGYGNGWLGYLPTAAAFEEGGYEPRTSPFTGQAEKDFGDGVITYLRGMPQ